MPAKNCILYASSNFKIIYVGLGLSFVAAQQLNYLTYDTGNFFQ
jgi:hypothetical protein